MGHDVAPEVCETLARVGRFVPRVALEHASQFLEFHNSRPQTYPLSEEGIREIMRTSGMSTSVALPPTTVTYLEALQSGPKGIQALSTFLTCGKEEIERVIEPYLVQLGSDPTHRKGTGDH